MLAVFVFVLAARRAFCESGCRPDMRTNAVVCVPVQFRIATTVPYEVRSLFLCFAFCHLVSE